MHLRRGREREWKERKNKGDERERRWREEFDPLKNFSLAPPMAY